MRPSLGFSSGSKSCLPQRRFWWPGVSMRQIPGLRSDRSDNPKRVGPRCGRALEAFTGNCRPAGRSLASRSELDTDKNAIDTHMSFRKDEPPRDCRRLCGVVTLTEGENWISLPSSCEEDEMARRGYPPEFRRRVVDLVEGGRVDSSPRLSTGLKGGNI